jgi:hypothetical protein
MIEGRLILALAAEADDDFIWSRLSDIQTAMFAAGPIAIKFGFFGLETEPQGRPFISTRWATDAADMQDLLDHARARCTCGCYVNIDDILAEALKQNEQAPVQAVVIIGDHFEIGHEAALVHAKQLHAVGTRLFLFRQGNRRSAHGADIFRTLAKTADGAYFEFNPAVERIAERLPHLLEAVASYAIGGTDALRALANESASMLLEQISLRSRREESRRFRLSF